MEETRAVAPSHASSGTKLVRDASDLDPAPKRIRKERTVKPLPPSLESISSNDFSKIHCAVEVYTKGSETLEAVLAQHVDTEVIEAGESINVRVDLVKDLNLCQLRRFCRQIGMKQTAACNKDACRRAIAMLINFEQSLSNAGLNPHKKEVYARNTLLRLVNVVFSPCFLDRFLKLNDNKNRWDHETGQMVKNFWKDTADAHNDNEDQESDLLLLVNNKNDEDLNQLLQYEETTVDLDEFDCVTAATIQKKVMTLIKMRRLIKENMGVSGTHNSRVLDFVDVAINKTKGGRMFNRLGVYYFYIRAEENGNAIDSAFQPFLDGSLKGSTAPEMINSDSESSLTGDDSNTTKKSPKSKSNKKSDQDAQEVNNAIVAMGGIREDTTKIANAIERANKIEEMKIKIDIARQLGDNDMLQEILASLG